MIAQRALRKEQARLHKQASAKTQATDAKEEPITSTEPVDDKKAKIAAAIAKAKAKKLAQKDQ